MKDKSTIKASPRGDKWSLREDLKLENLGNGLISLETSSPGGGAYIEVEESELREWLNR